MSSIESLSKDDKHRLKISIIIGFMSLVLAIPVFFGISRALGVILMITFVISTVYGSSFLEEDLKFGHILELLGVDNEEFQKRLAEEKEKQPANSTGVTNIRNTNLRKQVEDRIAEGWTIENIDNSSNRVVMSSTKGGNFAGHAVTGFLTGLWTFGAGNVVYNELSKKRNKERIAVSLEDSSTAQDSSDTPAEGVELISQLNSLRQEGAITDEEFESKKEEILKEI